MVTLSCQVDWIWNELKGKHLRTPVRRFLTRLFEVERPTLKVNSIFQWQPRQVRWGKFC